MPLSSTLTIQSYLGLRKESRVEYKKYVDIDDDGDFEEDELLDANDNGKVEDKEAWDFLARHAYRPKVAKFIEGKLCDSIVADIEEAPDSEKIKLLEFLLGYSKTNAAFFTLKVMQALTSLRNHENERIRNLSREIIYNKFTYKLPIPEPIKPIKPSQPFKLRETSPFWPLLSLEMDLPFPSFNVFDGRGRLDLVNTPYAVAADTCCEYYTESFAVGSFAFGYELMLYLFNVLGVGVGVVGDGIAEDKQGGEKPLSKLEADFQFVGPILEGRIPFNSETTKEKKDEVGFFGDYIPYWLSYDVNVKNLEGEAYRLGKINSSLFRAGFYLKTMAIPSWPVVEIRAGCGYRIMELEKVEHADIDNQTNFHLSYSPWALFFSLRFGSKILESW